MKHLDMKHIKVTDTFWKTYMELVRVKVIPYQWEALNDRIPGAEPSYCLRNFRCAAGIEKGSFAGMVFQDSDVYKWLEAVAFSLMWYPDEKLEKLADETISLIAAAQQPDGYLNTYYILNGLDKRFTNLRDNHELYCLGHMIEAAVAYFRATGKRSFLDISIRYVDCVERFFGSDKSKKQGYPGHEIIEMALMKLYELTEDQKYLKLAKFFIDERGKKPLYFEQEGIQNGMPFIWKDSYYQYQYYQAGQPVREQKTAEGHAVRAVYLYSGMASVAEATQDKELFAACEHLWNNIVQKQMYITGSIGAQQYGESFSFDYDLPNDAIYGETCAAIGLVFFALRMFDSTHDGSYIDVMERALYNGVLSGMSLEGTEFFYVNPLEAIPEAFDKLHALSASEYRRQKWFGCSCCPPNIARLISSLGEYAYAQDETTFFMNLYVGADIATEISGTSTSFTIETNYPWQGEIKINVQPQHELDFSLALRIPSWCSGASITVNGKSEQLKIEKGYAYIRRIWKLGDSLILSLPMETALYAAHPKVREDSEKTALMRGPLVYCLEEIDNGPALHTIRLNEDCKFNTEFDSKLLNGVMTVTTDASCLTQEGWKEGMLYQTLQTNQYEKKSVRFIPYYAWANRSPGEMIVWVNTRK